MINRTLILSIAFAGILSCSTSKKEGAIEDASQMTTEPTVKTEQLITGYEVIWGMDFLPNGDLLFTEKKGKLHRKSGDKITEITGLPVINTSGQGGLLDVRVSPQFNSNGWVFISYAGNYPGGGGSFNLMRFKLVNDQITETKILLTSNSANTMTGHYGSRIDFDEAGNLFEVLGKEVQPVMVGRIRRIKMPKTLIALGVKCIGLHKMEIYLQETQY